MNNENIRSTAICEYKDEDGVTALLIHQTHDEIRDYDVYYAVFDTAKITKAFKTLDELKKFLENLGFEEV